MTSASRTTVQIPLPSVEVPEISHLSTLLRQTKTLDLSREAKRLLHSNSKADRILKLFGIHPFEVTPLIDPYTKELEQGDFTNIGLHSVAVASFASLLCHKLVEAQALTLEQSAMCVERALLHDIGKRYEIFRRRAMGSGIPLDGASITHELRSLGVEPSKLDLLSQYGDETGGETIGQFLELGPQSELQLRTGRTCEKIVRLCDDMTASTVPDHEVPATTHFVTFLERALVSNFKQRYPIFFKAGIAINQSSDFVWASDLKELSNNPELRLVGDLLSVEQFFCEQVSTELCNLLGLSSCEDSQRTLLALI